MPRNSFGPRLAFAGFCALWSSPVSADEPAIESLRSLSIEQLVNLEVTSVSRRPESVGRTAASVELITADDIRRSGAQSIPEVLRLARNLEVAQIDAQRYAISARGFNSYQASNKLLVLIDGRSIYTPLYSGVIWDQHQVPLQDIERIEVVSGPGGTLWGANAVNGVINIVTRSAAQTLGFQAEAFAGSIDQRLDVHYGGGIGAGHYRLFATALDRGPTLLPNGDEAIDDWSGAQAGFRADWGGIASAFMLQGAAYIGDAEPNGSVETAHLLARWSRLAEDGSRLELQSYVSYSDRENFFAPNVDDSLRTWDISFNHNLPTLGRHQIVWGAGYRLDQSEFINNFNPFTFLEPERTVATANVFIQDEIALRDDLALTLGLKLEDHTFTDWEYMPNVRLAWRLSDTTMVWGAVSRAVRTPSRIDFEIQFPGVIVPGGFESEILVAYELGYRRLITQDASFAATLYYHDYDRLRTSSLSSTGGLPARVGNDLEGEVYGLEMWADWGAMDNWRLSAGLTLLEQDFRATAPFAFNVNASGDDPGYQFFLRSRADLTDNLTLDMDLRAIEETAPQIPSYVEVNARLGWQITENVELALSGQNLLDEAHFEAIDRATLQQARRNVQISARISY